MSGDVRPFPYASLESLSRSEIALARAARALGAAHIDADALCAELSRVCGAPASLRLRGASLATSSRAADAACAVAIASADATSLASAAVLVAEVALAARLVAGALKRDAPRVTDASRAAAPALSGALGAIVLSAARRAHAGRPLRILAAGPAPTLARDVLALVTEIAEIRLTLSVGEDVFDAALLVPHALMQAPPRPAFDDARLAALGSLPLSLPVVVSVSSAAPSEITALSIGDAWLPGDIALAADDAGAIAGPVRLISPSGEIGLAATLVEGAKVMVGGLTHSAWSGDAPGSAPASEDDRMSEDTSAATRAVEEAPVVVRVEIGAATMTAREWSQVASGDVVTLDRRVHDPVSLRVGGVEIARGELVQVDGELGVRVTSRVREGT